MNPNPAPAEPWWYVLGYLLATLLGAVLKTFVDLVGRRDSRDEKWRQDLLTDQRELRAWCGRQQDELENYHARVQTLEKNVKGEQDLRHEIKNRLAAEQLAHEGLKHDYAKAEERLSATTAENVALREANAALSAQVATLTDKLARCAEKGPAGDGKGC